MTEIQNPQASDITDADLLREINRIQGRLQSCAPAQIAEKCGAAYDGQKLTLQVLFAELHVDADHFTITDGKGESPTLMIQSLVLSYLITADGTPASATPISFRELPGGSIYCQAFQGYGPDMLAKHFGNGGEGFAKACRKLGGTAADFGDMAFTLTVFPRIPMTAVYYLGDDDFPASATLLFDSSVPHYMVTAGLASIGAALVNLIIKTAPAP